MVVSYLGLHVQLSYCYLGHMTVVLLQIITHIFLWPVKLMFRHFSGNVCTTNVSSVILCGLSWHRPGEKCICTGSVSWEVAKGGTNTCAPGVGAVAGKVPRSANISGSGLMIWFFLLFVMRSSMQCLCRSMCDLGRSWSKDKQGICVLNQSSLVQSEGVLTWTHCVIPMPGIFHIPFKGG